MKSPDLATLHRATINQCQETRRAAFCRERKDSTVNYQDQIDTEPVCTPRWGHAVSNQLQALADKVEELSARLDNLIGSVGAIESDIDAIKAWSVLGNPPKSNPAESGVAEKPFALAYGMTVVLPGNVWSCEQNEDGEELAKMLNESAPRWAQANGYTKSAPVPSVPEGIADQLTAARAHFALDRPIHHALRVAADILRQLPTQPVADTGEKAAKANPAQTDFSPSDAARKRAEAAACEIVYDLYAEPGGYRGVTKVPDLNKAIAAAILTAESHTRAEIAERVGKVLSEYIVSERFRNLIDATVKGD